MNTQGPIIILSYPHSGARYVQDALARGTDLACTSGTGIIPQCAAAAETWSRVEGGGGPGMSRLAASSIRGLVMAQMTVISASCGGSRWCELANAPPSVVTPFLQLFPDAVVVCVHRRCPDVIRAGVQANPWGLADQGMGSYLLSYLGNNVGALASRWADSTEELLAFEKEHSAITYRVRYEDVIAEPDQVLPEIGAWLGLAASQPDLLHSLLDAGDPQAPEAASFASGEVPEQMIPPALRQRISRLHAELGHVPPGEPRAVR